ncbi:MAG: RNA methyltransferase [Patescibacteria group bacterium]
MEIITSRQNPKIKEIRKLIADEKRLAVDKEIYADLAIKKDIQGVGAVVRQKISRNTLFDGAGVVLENIANPGNLGAIARLCAAFSIKNLYVIKPAVEFFQPEAVRASMGAIFHLSLVYFDSLAELKEQLNGRGFAVIGTSLQDDSVDLAMSKPHKSSNLLFLFGGEAKGLSSEAKEICDSLVKIPISGAVDSLNLAESAAIVIYELSI